MRGSRHAFLAGILSILSVAQFAAVIDARIKSGTIAPASTSTTDGDPRDPGHYSDTRLETELLRVAPTLRPEALHAALDSWGALRARGELARPLLSVIDYSLPSTTQRLWVFDLASRRLLFHELVAHGRNSGEDLARSFSNEEGSLKSSLGAFVTGTTYFGRNGYSMRLRGMEPGVNDHAEARTIVVHGAPYVDEAVSRKLGRLGRSHGCPALRPGIARALIDEIKDRTLLYAWFPSNALTLSRRHGENLSCVRGIV